MVPYPARVADLAVPDLTRADPPRLDRGGPVTSAIAIATAAPWRWPVRDVRPAELAAIAVTLGDAPGTLASELLAAIDDEPSLARDGGFARADANLDAERALA